MVISYQDTTIKKKYKINPLNRPGRKKGSKAWNKGLTKYDHPSIMSVSRKVSLLTKNGVCGLKGKKHREESKKKIGIGNSGSNNGSWKGGISPEVHRIRNSAAYQKWRKQVIKRDREMCVWCHSKYQLQADHIQSFKLHPELRFDVNNGRTLCFPCHRKTSTWGNGSKEVS